MGKKRHGASEDREDAGVAWDPQKSRRQRLRMVEKSHRDVGWRPASCQENEASVVQGEQRCLVGLRQAAVRMAGSEPAGDSVTGRPWPHHSYAPSLPFLLKGGRDMRLTCGCGKAPCLSWARRDHGYKTPTHPRCPQSPFRAPCGSFGMVITF